MKILKDKDILNVARKKATHRNVKINRANEAGFAIIAVLTILAVCVALVVAMLTMTGNDRQSSAAYINKTRLDMALETALNDATITLEQSTDNDHFITLKIPDDYNTSNTDKDNKDAYFYYNAKFANGNWKYYPLFSTTGKYSKAIVGNATLQGGSKAANGNKNLSDPANVYDKAEATSEGVDFEDNVMDTPQWQSKQRPGWRELNYSNINNAKNNQKSMTDNMSHDKRYTIRYRYWIEDLQGYLPLELAGNTEGSNSDHERFPHGAYDLDKPIRDGVTPAIFSIFVNDLMDMTQRKADTRYHHVPGMVISDSNYNFDLFRQDHDTSNDPISPANILNLNSTDYYPSPLSKTALYSLFQSVPVTSSNTSEDGRTEDNDIQELKSFDATTGMLAQLLFNKDSVSYNFSDSSRTDGRLNNNTARIIEENFAVGISPYLECPKVPMGNMKYGNKTFGPYINAGKNKINLNEILFDLEEGNITNNSAVSALSNQISDALGNNFANDRKGGMPEDYLRTLAASIIDYADTDSQSTRSGSSDNVSTSGGYRGLDSMPLVNELIYTITRNTGNDTTYDFDATPWIELWNPTNQFIAGNVSFKFELHHTVYATGQGNIKVPLMEVINGNGSQYNNSSVSPTNNLLGPVYVELAPNEYKIVEFPNLNFQIITGQTGLTGKKLNLKYGSPQDATVNEPANYQLHWQPTYPTSSSGSVIVDRSVGSMRYVVGTYGADVGDSYVHVFYPGAQYGTSGTPPEYVNNPGDPMTSYYNDYFLKHMRYASDGIFTEETSPWGRNVGSEYYVSDTPRLYGEVKPSRWPDGGHASMYTSNGEEIRSYAKAMDALDAGATGEGNYKASWTRTSILTSFTQPTSLSDQNENKKYSAYHLSPWKISNLGIYFSATELGHIYDPIMWGTNTDLNTYNSKINEAYSYWNFPIDDTYLETNSSYGNSVYGGGNSLRVGRLDHDRFLDAGMPASRLLDLFYAGKFRSLGSGSTSDPDNTTVINGHINVNTVSEEVLRSVLAGSLKSDPNIAVKQSNGFSNDLTPVENTNERIVSEQGGQECSYIANQIISNRPFSSKSEISQILDNNNAVFGNKNSFNNKDNIIWNDSAAEELFARLYNSSTLRSRNYRIHYEAQIIKKTRAGSNKVLAKAGASTNIFLKPNRDNLGEVIINNGQASFSKEYSHKIQN